MNLLLVVYSLQEDIIFLNKQFVLLGEQTQMKSKKILLKKKSTGDALESKNKYKF